MPSDNDIKKIFLENKTIAVVGMSRNPGKPARRIPAFLLTKGYTIIPVNPAADKIIGRTSYPTLGDVPETIDIVEVFRPSDEALQVIEEAVARKKLKGDIRVIWLQQGIASDEGKKLAEAAGIEYVEDRCMFTEYERLMP